MKKVITINQRALSENDKNANDLRELYKKYNKFVINLMSSPGSGKTTLLESLSDFEDFRFCVIEGDLQTNRDSDRLEKKGILSKQITTGEACHLDASMIKDILPKLVNDYRFQNSEFLFIENVGNLVCPASYDLGANVNIVLLSTTEGDDKVLKYPSMFLCADLILITKYDIKEHFNFDINNVKKDIDSLRNNIEILEISANNKEQLNRLIRKIVHLKSINYASNHVFT